MVTEVPNNNEFLGISLKEEIDNLYDYEGRTLEDNAFAIALLYFLTDFNNKYSTKTYNYVEKHYKDDLETLREKLIRKADTETDNLFKYHSETTMKEYNIPESKYNKVTNPHTPNEIKNTINSTINGAINQIRDDITTKLNVWKDDIAKKPKDFNIKPNINRLTRRIRNTIDYATSRIKWHSRTGIQKFVFEEKQLYDWYCAGPNPCPICIEKSKQAPKTIDEWESDHPNGYCILIPVGEPSYTTDYTEIIGGREI